MIKNTFKDIWFLGGLSWVKVHSQTQKYLEIISTPGDEKVKHVRVFQTAWKGKGKISPPSGGMGNFGEGRDFFNGRWKSVEEWFWQFKPFWKLKTIFCKHWTLIKPKFAWSVCTNSMKLKWKWYRRMTTAKNRVFIGL